MKKLISFSVGNKIIVALSGLFLITFIVIHLSGNFILFAGKDAFNTYSYLLTKNKVILYVLEVILIVGFLTHIIMTVRLTLKNRKARPISYQKVKKFGKSTIFSSNMGITGSFIFIFLVVHIKTFKYGEAGLVPIDSFPGVMTRDLYLIVTSSFNSGLYVLFYCLAMLLLGGHLSHGLQSSFKSFGLYNTKWETMFRRISIFIGIILGGGFMSIPLYFYFID